ARGVIDKYMWLDLGSSYVPSEIIAAFLWAQLQCAEEITQKRLAIWSRYHDQLAPLEAAGVLRRPVVPEGRAQNAHMYYVLARTEALRTDLLSHLSEQGINAVSHYVPLHLAPAGRRFGAVAGRLDVTERCAARLIRLPLWAAMADDDIGQVVDAVFAWARS